MKLVEAGYEILVLLAISDRHYHEKELKNIKKFLAVNFNNPLDIDLNERHNEILALNSESRLQRLITIAEHFQENTNLKNRMVMLNYALELILADHKVTEEERIRFKVLGEFWDIDLEKFIDKKLIGFVYK